MGPDESDVGAGGACGESSKWTFGSAGGDGGDETECGYTGGGGGDSCPEYATGSGQSLDD